MEGHGGTPWFLSNGLHLQVGGGGFVCAWCSRPQQRDRGVLH